MRKFKELGCAPAPWTAEANAMAFCVLPALYDAASRAYAFLAHSSLIGAAEVRAELEAADGLLSRWRIL